MADTPKQLEADTLRDLVASVNAGSREALEKDIQELTTLLGEHRLFVSPEADIAHEQEQTRKTIAELGGALKDALDPETSAQLEALSKLIDAKFEELKTPASTVGAQHVVPAPAPAAPDAGGATVLDFAAAKAARDAAAATASNVGAQNFVPSPTNTPAASPNAAPNRAADVDAFISRMLENDSDRTSPITQIVERKLTTNTTIDLAQLGNFIGTPALILSAEAKAHISKNPHDLQSKKHEKEGELEDAKEAWETAKSLGGNIRAAEKTQQAVLEAQKRMAAIRKELRALEEALAYVGNGRTYKPKELLLMVNNFINQKETKSNIARATDREIETAQTRINKADWRNNGALGILKPTLKETLKGLAEAPELEHVEAKKLAELAHAETETKVKKWVEGLEGKEENYTTTVPALIAYLKAAIADETGNTKVNRLSDKYFRQLVRNLQAARNSHLAGRVEKEHAGATNQKKMMEYFKLLSQSDETAVKVDHHLLSDIMTKSYIKASVKLAAAPIAAWYLVPALGWGAISTAVGWLGWGNVAAGVGYGVARSKVEHLPPEYRTMAKSVSARALGCFVLGPVGLLAPELFNGAKFLFRHRAAIKKGTETTASVAGTTAKVGGKVIAAPFKGVAKAVNAVRGKKAA